ncbi:hypothetical protein Mal64_21350 [Pseudobythopirellula maris]|uniref:DnaJ domain protein n=1 Tax=Pseudobythopirellula maris TaxID=2527991 RepID=A0A5C5ZNA3_9BACT|nr:hypothetical protein [Pseudobythopirellula maris]TWT88648.1 hypothetical protein Mal64_21350 [Pseudobythopirellula maris]
MTPEPWPDAVDSTAILYLAAVLIGLPAAGYVFAVLDYRAYLRSLKHALVVVSGYMGATPYWALRDRPECLREFGLTEPVTREEVYAAYRQRVKHAHPDRGGDRREFDRLQQHLQDALRLASDAV